MKPTGTPVLAYTNPRERKLRWRWHPKSYKWAQLLRPNGKPVLVAPFKALVRVFGAEQVKPIWEECFNGALDPVAERVKVPWSIETGDEPWKKEPPPKQSGGG